MEYVGYLILDVLSFFTGRAIWFELAAKLAERQGDRNSAIELRNQAFRERMK